MKRRISVWVWTLHILWIVTLCCISPKKSNPKRTLVVSTRVENKMATSVSEKSVATSAPVSKKQPVASKPVPKKQVTTQPNPQKKQATSAAPEPKKNTSSVKKEVKKIEAPPAVSQDLARQLEESIAKIDKKRDNLWREDKRQTPSTFEPVHIDISSYEGSFTPDICVESLVSCLQEQLHVPDYGEVTVDVTIAQDGRVMRMIIVQAESEKNRQYIEQHLPHVRFPKLEKQQSFTLTFCTGF